MNNAQKRHLRQRVFDRVAAHLLKQRARSEAQAVDPKKGLAWERPAYRGTNNRKCAIGCLIDDAAYSAVLEGQAVCRDPVVLALVNSGMFPDEETADVCAGLLQQLQDLHDCIQVPLWGVTLHEVADKWNLETSDLPPPELPPSA